METSHTITSPSDWLPTLLPTFSSLDTALRCQICKDFFATPMLTSCAHTFCSKCIRTCLSGDGKCPTCRTADQASKLRNNFAVEEAVNAFIGARTVALEVAVKAVEREEGDERGEGGRVRSGKRRRVSYEGVGGDGNGETTQRRQTRSMRSRGPNTGASPASTSTQMDAAVEIMDTDSGDETFEPEDGLVACPICSTRMLEKQVDPHIGSGECDGTKKEDKTAGRAPVKAKITVQPPPPSSRPHSAKPQERLAELNYSMLTENALRKKIAQLGLPTVGSKVLLKERHTEWVNLWNANCDSRNPKSKQELLADLRKWERAQGSQAKTTADGAGIMEKDFDAVGWQRNNADDFTRLIQEAKKKREQAKAKAAKTEDDSTTTTANGSTGDEFLASNEVHTAPQDQQQPATLTTQSLPADPYDKNPYENNPAAISSIRAKVEALNNGTHIEPLMNQDFARGPPTPTTPSHHRDGSLTQQSPSSSRPQPALRKESSIGEHFADVPDRRTSMFRMPEDPISDNERML